VTHLLWNLARLHGLRSAVFSPEMPTKPQLRDRLRRIIGENADAQIEDKFVSSVQIRRGRKTMTSTSLDHRPGCRCRVAVWHSHPGD